MNSTITLQLSDVILMALISSGYVVMDINVLQIVCFSSLVRSQAGRSFDCQADNISFFFRITEGLVVFEGTVRRKSHSPFSFRSMI